MVREKGERGEPGKANGWRTVLYSVGAAIASGAIVQLAAAIWWGASVMFRLEQVEIRSKENMAALMRLEERGFRGIPVIEQQLRDIREHLVDMQRGNEARTLKQLEIERLLLSHIYDPSAQHRSPPAK